MERRPWLERVANELDRRGVPARHRSRFLAELRDHLDDLTEEGFDMANEANADARLGTPADVAAVAATEYARCGWFRRHPVVAFGLLPVPVTMMCLVGYIL